jgi:hypothetical protein
MSALADEILVATDVLTVENLVFSRCRCLDDHHHRSQGHHLGWHLHLSHRCHSDHLDCHHHRPPQIVAPTMMLVHVTQILHLGVGPM